jgi:intein-encoded DNA endonuclease-like protein
MDRYGLQRRSTSEAMRKFSVSKKWLVKLYWDRKLSTYKIAEIFGVNRMSVQRRMQAFKILTRRQSELRELQKKLREKPRELSYVLGVTLGDAGIYNVPSERGERLRFYMQVKSETFARSVYNALKKLGLNPFMHKTRKRRREYLCVGANSTYFGRWFRRQSMEGLKLIVTSSRGNTIAFIRGFYESEGSCYERQDQPGNYTIAIYNTDARLLSFVKTLIQKMGFHPTVTKDARNPRFKNLHRLSLYRQNEIVKFLPLISPCIKNRVLVSG